MKTSPPSLRFVRTDPDDALKETLSIVRHESGSIHVLVNLGTPAAPGGHVGLYEVGGDEVRLTGAWSMVPGDRLTGKEARDVAEDLADAARRYAGPNICAQDYLAPDGSLPFSAIFADWEHGGTKVAPWHDPAVAA